MSQEKVDRYKEEKANRKQILKRNKIKKTVYTILGTVASLAVVAWIGYSGYGYFQSQKEANKPSTEIDISAATDYLSGLYPEEAEDGE